MALFETAIQYGTRADQPSAASVGAGVLYCVSDEGGAIERSNGSTWDAVGGGGAPAILMASVPVSAAEIKALDSVAKVLLPAPGGRFYYVVHNVVMHYRFVTAPYVDSDTAALWIGYGTDLVALAQNFVWGAIYSLSSDFTVAQILQQVEDAYIQSSPAYENVQNGWFGSVIENQPLTLGNGAVPYDPDGDSTLTFRIWYSLIDGAP